MGVSRSYTEKPKETQSHSKGKVVTLSELLSASLCHSETTRKSIICRNTTISEDAR